MAKTPIPLIVPVQDPPEDDAPKCPPVGAPAWMATFADIAILLMAFFVLILSFAEMNVPKFKTVSGSLRESFGIQREVPVVEQPRGTTLLTLEFSPSPDPSVIPEITQDTTDTERPELQTDQTGTDGDGMDGETGTAELAAALQEALESGQVTIETREGEMSLNFPAQGATRDSTGESAQDSAESSAEAEQVPDPAESLARILNDLAQAGEAAQGAGQGEGAEQGSGQSERSAQIAEAELRVALRQEVAQGLVTVEQREDRVLITVGAGGAFPSGQADLTAAARDVMARIAFSAMDEASRIEVTGHTDDVPVNPASPFRDNWGLGAARAASVVRELTASGLIEPDRLIAMSRGEIDPVADNSNAAGKEQNRRIEIEITY